MPSIWNCTTAVLFQVYSFTVTHHPRKEPKLNEDAGVHVYVTVAETSFVKNIFVYTLHDRLLIRSVYTVVLAILSMNGRLALEPIIVGPQD